MHVPRYLLRELTNAGCQPDESYLLVRDRNCARAQSPTIWYATDQQCFSTRARTDAAITVRVKRQSAGLSCRQQGNASWRDAADSECKLRYRAIYLINEFNEVGNVRRRRLKRRRKIN